MAAHPKTSAKSRYRQVRLTFTQESMGRVSLSLYAKGLNSQWNEHACLLRDQVAFQGRLDTTEDVIWACLQVLDGMVLPHHAHWVHCALRDDHPGTCRRSEVPE